MAGINLSDPFDNHHENAGFSNDDFEKVEAVGSGFSFDQDNNDADSQGFDRNQDAEVSTTTDNAGEDKAEEDLYCVDCSEVEANTQSSSEPLISVGENEKDQIVDANDRSSAPMSDIDKLKLLIDFAESTADNILSSLTTAKPFSVSGSPEPIPTTRTSLEVEEVGDIQTESDKKSIEVEQVTEEITEENGTIPEQEASDVHVPSDVKIDDFLGPLDETVIYKRLVAIGTWLKGVDPRESKEEKAGDSSQPSSCCFKDLIYWRDVKKTGVVFGTMLVLLLSLAIFSLVSVVAYLSLAVLTVTFSFVVYKKIMGAVQKSNDGHPFKPLLEMDITLSEEKLKSVIQNILKNTNCTLREVRRLFLVEDTVDSIKFGLLLWALTYIGSWFNGMSLIILALILLFTVPKVYETYQVQIDTYINLAKSHINNVLTIIQSKLPFLKKKEKAN